MRSILFILKNEQLLRVQKHRKEMTILPEKNKKILLIRTTSSKSVIPPLGLLYIASVIRNRYKEYNIKIIDFLKDEDKKYVKDILDFSPDIIGFSALNPDFTIFKKLCVLCRQVVPQSILIAGGPLATNYDIDIVKNKLVDFAIRGEGELTITELLDIIHNKGNPSCVNGITYLKDGEVIVNPPREFIRDIDTIPFPAWDLINLKRYSKIPNWNGILFKKYYAPIITSRGCVYNCIYCHKLFGKEFRARTAENVISEMEFLYKDYDIREFHIIDDLFNFDLERIRDICNGIINKRLKIKISFPNGIRVDKMDKETLLLLKKAGTYKINYAIETASPRLQKFIKKNVNLEKAKKTIEETSKSGIITFGFFMFGFPTETAAEMEETISFAVDSKLDTAKFFKAIPFANTELATLTANFCYGDDLYSEGDPYYDENINVSNLPTDFLNNVILKSHWRFYAKLSRIFRIFIKYRNFDVIKRLFTLYRYLLMKKHKNDKREIMKYVTPD